MNKKPFKDIIYIVYKKKSQYMYINGEFKFDIER